MFRFAFAYQGSGTGGNTYLAGGAMIDVTAETATIDLQNGDPVSAEKRTAGIDIELMKALDITHDPINIDL